MARTETKDSMLKSRSLQASDDPIQPFLAPDFDVFAHLNTVLPTLDQNTRQLHISNATRLALLSNLSERTQGTLHQLSAQSTRLSNRLTQITDDILRSGSRLGYEVEVLRGQTITLAESLNEDLRQDIQRFIPASGESVAASSTAQKQQNEVSGEIGEETREKDAEETVSENELVKSPSLDLPSIEQLRTLNTVRSRLDDVIHVFGEAMEWVLPPSEVSVASSFISISAPEPGKENESAEDKGQEMMKRLRDEVENLLNKEPGGKEGVEKASCRVEALRTLAEVWKGTAEEKARSKFVDSLAKMVEDRRQTLFPSNQGAKQQLGQGTLHTSRSRRSSEAAATREERQTNEGGLGFMRNLQRLREEIYLD